jgi:hypothetical protein
MVDIHLHYASLPDRIIIYLEKPMKQLGYPWANIETSIEKSRLLMAMFSIHAIVFEKWLMP